MRYRQVGSGEWVKPKRKYHYMKCCDCGLVHKVEFALGGTKDKRIILLRAYRVK